VGAILYVTNGPGLYRQTERDGFVRVMASIEVKTGLDESVHYQQCRTTRHQAFSGVTTLP
jgi:hypothetical protein